MSIVFSLKLSSLIRKGRRMIIQWTECKGCESVRRTYYYKCVYRTCVYRRRYMFVTSSVLAKRFGENVWSISIFFICTTRACRCGGWTVSIICSHAATCN